MIKNAFYIALLALLFAGCKNSPGKETDNHDEEEVKVLEIDLAKTDQYRTHWPFMRDRRIDSYEPITKRFIDED